MKLEKRNRETEQQKTTKGKYFNLHHWDSGGGRKTLTFLGLNLNWTAHKEYSFKMGYHGMTSSTKNLNTSKKKVKSLRLTSLNCVSLLGK